MTIQIQTIKLHQLKMNLNNPFRTSFGTVTDRDFYIIEVIDRDGYRGYGETVAFTSPWYTEETVQTVYHMMTDFLIKQLQEHPIEHPDDLMTIFTPIRGNHMAKAALEGAIWDLYAKRQGLTLAEALGGVRTVIDAGISLGIQTDMKKLLQTIENAVHQGFKRIKLKIRPGHDIEVLKTIRQHFPDIALMVDANSAYSLKDIEHLKKFDEFQLLMIEQPLDHNDILEHRQLQQQIDTPICLDESIYSLHDVKLAVELGSCQVINIKPGRVGGLTEAKRIHDYCQDHHIPVWCGGMLESGIGRAHNIALATLPNFTIPGDIVGSSHYWKEDIIVPEVIVNNGQITVSNQSGLGYDINESALHKYRKNVHTYNV